MKRYLANQNGIALVTSLMLTLISLTIVMSVMYMITQNIQRTGAHKSYKTALEASVGGTEIFVKELMPQILINSASPTLVALIQDKYSAITLQIGTTPDCLFQKLTLDTASWNSACSKVLSPKVSPDIRFQLQATGGQPYAIYTKIADTIIGNSVQGGLWLEGAGVTDASTIVTPLHIPFIYRLEVQAERATNALEQTNISVVYAY